jgi:CheY-like chemotaxis protein
MAKILIVEDEAIIAMELQDSLEAQGHVVPAIVDSGDEVIPAVLSHRPDLILMDIKLRSFIDGIDAASRLRLVSGVPIVYITAYPSRGSLDRAKRTAPVAYLAKPLDDAELREVIASALSGFPRPSISI